MIDPDHNRTVMLSKINFSLISVIFTGGNMSTPIIQDGRNEWECINLDCPFGIEWENLGLKFFLWLQLPIHVRSYVLLNSIIFLFDSRAKISNPVTYIGFVLFCDDWQDETYWPLMPPLPSYGYGREHPGPRYGSLIHGQNLKDVVITGEFILLPLEKSLPLLHGGSLYLVSNIIVCTLTDYHI